MITYSSSVDPGAGWFMEYLEKNDQVYFFSINTKKEGSKKFGSDQSGDNYQYIYRDGFNPPINIMA